MSAPALVSPKQDASPPIRPGAATAPRLQFNYAKSVHEQALEKLFGKSAFVSGGHEPFQCVVIAFVNRSGSNYLAELLKSTGAFAGLGECLNAHNMGFLAPRYGATSFAEYLIRHRREDTEYPGQIWGLKAGWMQLAMLNRFGAIPNLLRPQLLLVRRRDCIGQAISYFIAEQTAQWTSGDKATRARSDIPYDGEQILKHFRGIVDSYAKLEQVAILSGCPFQSVVYEDLVDAPHATITRLTGALIGRELAPQREDVRLSIQRDGLNNEFRARFLADLRDLTWQAG